MTTLPEHSHEPRAPLYCPFCGSTMENRLLEHDERQRLVCPTCSHVYYINPKMVAATLPEQGGRVLLIRRAIEPRLGFWTYPAGFLEFGESVEEGATRETREEASVEVAVESLLGVYSRPSIGIVVVVYRASVVGGEASPGIEALETGWFSADEIPWSDLAFDTTEWALKDWVRAVKAEEGR